MCIRDRTGAQRSTGSEVLLFLDRSCCKKPRENAIFILQTSFVMVFEVTGCVVVACFVGSARTRIAHVALLSLASLLACRLLQQSHSGRASQMEVLSKHHLSAARLLWQAQHQRVRLRAARPCKNTTQGHSCADAPSACLIACKHQARNMKG